MSWTAPRLDKYGNSTPSDHVLPKGWWDNHDEIGEPHTSKQLQDWFNINHKCINCGKIVRSHQQAGQNCVVVRVQIEEKL